MKKKFASIWEEKYEALKVKVDELEKENVKLRRVALKAEQNGFILYMASNKRLSKKTEK